MKTIFNKYRPLSFSAISSFQYDKEAWYRKYILHEKQISNAAMDFGKEIGLKLATDSSFMPEVPRYPIFEKELRSRVNGLHILGYLDSFQEKPMAILEYKTSHNKNRWTQRSAEDHGQILFYLALCWLNYQIPPEEIKCNLIYIPVEEKGDFTFSLAKEPIQNFEIKHTALEVLNYLNFINKIHAEMIDFAEKHSR